jgi:putative copper resistance protein D
LDAILAALRFVEYGGAMILFGSSLLLIFGRLVPSSAGASDLAWTRRLLFPAALALLLATVVGFVVQTIKLTGSLALASQAETLKSALWQMDFGTSSLIRSVLAGAALCAAVFLPAGRWLWWICTAFGALICSSFAWMGHGAATEGAMGLLHLIADIAHTLAAAGWIGALVVFVVVLMRPPSSVVAQEALSASLASFSGVGTILVAIIVASGLINSIFLVGWNIEQAVAVPYGQVLVVKLLLFLLMLALAAMNRFRHTPAFECALQSGAPTNSALIDLRRSVLAETGIAGGVLALVAWLGMLAPVTGQ